MPIVDDVAANLAVVERWVTEPIRTRSSTSSCRPYSILFWDKVIREGQDGGGVCRHPPGGADGCCSMTM